MPQKSEPHQLASGLVIDSKVNPWMYREDPVRLLGVSFTVSAVQCEQDAVYKVRAHGVKDPDEKAQIKANAQGLVKAGDLQIVFVQFSYKSLASIRLAAAVDGVEYPIDIDRSECFTTPEKPKDVALERLGLMTPLRAGLSQQPTPMKSVARSAARVYNSLKHPGSGRATSVPPPSLGRQFISPRGSSLSSTPIKAPLFDDTITTVSHFSVPTASTDSLPGVTDEHIKRLDELIPKAGGVTSDDLWMMIYYFVMDVFVSLGHYAREWFMRGGPETKVLLHAREQKIFWEPEMTLECLVVTMLIDHFEKYVDDMEKALVEGDAEKTAIPLDVEQSNVAPAVDWYNNM